MQALHCPAPACSWSRRTRAPCRAHSGSPRQQQRPRENRLAAASALQPSSHADSGVSRRELLGLAAPLLLLGALPAGLLAAPQAARAAGPTLPSKEVQAALDKALARSVTKGKAAVALRLVFHDAGTFSAAAKDGGLNASIQYELGRPENMGLKRGWRVVEQVRQDLRGTAAEGVVSDADLVALAGAYGIRICGGPAIAVPIGRPTAAAGSQDPPDRMPAETFSAAELKASFAAKGFSVKELVVLSGAHTLGSKGYGDPNRFDTEYFRSLLRKPWLATDDPMASMIGLPSDHVLPDDPECLPYIQRYAEDQEAFFADFAAAYFKLTGLGVAGWA